MEHAIIMIKDEIGWNFTKFTLGQTRRLTMYESMEITQERVATFDTEIEVAELELGNSKLGLGIIMIMAAFVGIWGVACLIGGLSSTSGIHELGRSLVTALTGM
jgi:hypothetical protein